MNKRDRVASESRITVRNADDEPKRWRTFLLMGVCLTLLVSGFFFAGRQHFSSMDYGMKNAKLRNQIVQLEAEKRRLVLAREVSLSPGVPVAMWPVFAVNWIAEECLKAFGGESLTRPAAKWAMGVAGVLMVLGAAAWTLNAFGLVSFAAK